MSKIYKYTSLSSAIKIIKSEKIILNKPLKFNDPFDCSFSSDKKDEKKSFDLLINYCAIKVLFDLINNKKLVLTKVQKILFNVIRIELKIMKKLLKINPRYSKIPIINWYIKYVIKTKPELKIDLNQISEKFKKTINEKLDAIKDTALISCFSKRNDSILMWSHYADSHRGACLEFEEPEQEEFGEVKYTNKRPMIKMYNLFSTYIAYDFIGKTIETEEFKYAKDLIKPFFVKSKEWSYEEEIRCIFSTKDYRKNKISYDGENFFVNVGKIKKIYIGSKANSPEIDKIIKLANHRKIEVVFMKESTEKFIIIPDLNHKREESIILKEEKISILRIIKEIENLLEKDIYIPAFVLALNIPAICGAKEYADYNEEEQYKKWTFKWFSKYEKNPQNSNFPYESPDLLFDIRKEFFNHGTFNVNKEYNEFKLEKIILRIENKNPFNLYIGNSKNLELTINVRDFCLKLINLGKKFYQDNINFFNEKDNIIIENYSEKIDEYIEFMRFNKQQ